MNNSTLHQLTENEGPFNGPGFLAFVILVVLIILVASLMMGFTISALLKAKSIPRLVRLFLINLLFAGLLVAVAVMSIAITAIVLATVSSNHSRPRYLCRVYLWAFATGIVARLWSLAAFALLILALVRVGTRSISKWTAAVIILVLWLVPMALCLYILLPYVYEAQFSHGVACFPDNNRTIIVQARYTFLATWAIFGGLTPLAVSIIVPIVCLCCIRREIAVEGTQYRKQMAKFSIFLLFGGSINIAGLILPGLLSLKSATPAVYLSYSCVVLSLLPTPIIIMAFLKPVRKQAKKMITRQLTKGAKEMKKSCDATLSMKSTDI